jgi:SNF2 family DNA or RNA helicase
VTRTYGKISLCGNVWRITAEPHILLRMKRVFERINKQEHGAVTLAHTPENCRDLSWFLDRYPLDISAAHLDTLDTGSAAHREHILTMEKIADPNYTPTYFNLALPAREYQRLAAEIFLRQGYLLLGDDVGLGKTVSAICSFTDPRTLPALIVTKTVLPKQWQSEIARFAPGLSTHIIKKGTPYALPMKSRRGPDVLIINYHKLGGWAEVLAQYVRTVVFDEIQELRTGMGSNKYAAAVHIARACQFCLGLSATPIYNYGGEIFNVIDALRQDALGTHDEFLREWCTHEQKPKLRDPKAFGTYLRENFIMLRRTREDVGRELPAVTRVPHRIDSDSRAHLAVERSAAELARIILGQIGATKEERFNAAGKLNGLVRQATGIAKAPYVAEFVRMLVESGEQVLLCGWHREVYSIWESKLKDLRTAYFTGSESVNQKEEAKRRFIARDLDVLFLSLRSGEGIDGFQHSCRTIVFGELDWTPGVHEQCIGRIHRDGQAAGVVAYFLVSEDGADPIMAEVLGLKRQQVEGIRNPHQDLIEKLDTSGDHVRRLAEHYIRRKAV